MWRKIEIRLQTETLRISEVVNSDEDPRDVDTCGYTWFHGTWESRLDVRRVGEMPAPVPVPVPVNWYIERSSNSFYTQQTSDGVQITFQIVKSNFTQSVAENPTKYSLKVSGKFIRCVYFEVCFLCSNLSQLRTSMHCRCQWMVASSNR